MIEAPEPTAEPVAVDGGRTAVAAGPALQSRLQDLVGDGLVLALAGAWTAGEDPSDEPPGVSRARQFRFGREALARVIRELDLDANPVGVRFPHPRLSLSHTGRAAVAVGARMDDVCGTGVDLEAWRPIDAQAARFFLDPDELIRWPDWVIGSDDQSTTLLRLWTVKEAVFKADTENAGRTLRDYRVARFGPSPGRMVGAPRVGRAHRPGATFAFRCFRLDDLILTVARRERTPQ